MYLRPHRRSKDGKVHAYWSLVETVRMADGPRQRAICYLGELNNSAQARWVKTIEVFNEQGDTRQLKLFPSTVALPEDDPQVARVLVHKVRLERTRSFGSCFLGLELWKRLELDRFFAEHIDCEAADVPWSRIAALLAIHRLCAPGSELAIEQRWYPIVPTPSASGVDNAQPMMPMRALALLSTLQGTDIVLPTTDGREIRLRRITEPTTEQKSLLRQLGISLPERLRLQCKCSADSAVA